MFGKIVYEISIEADEEEKIFKFDCKNIVLYCSIHADIAIGTYTSFQ